MIRRLTDPPPRLRSLVPGIPPELLQLCDRLLANEPRNRPLCAADALQMLCAIAPDPAPFDPATFGVISVGPWSSEVETRVASSSLTSPATFEEISSDELGLCVGMQTSWSQAGSGDEGLRGLLENLLDTRAAAAPQVRARLDFWLERVPGAHAAFSREVEIFLRPSRSAAPDAGLPLRVAVEAIYRAASLRPVLLWLDDVQWSRGEAGALITAIRAREPSLPVCIIATVRGDEIADRAAYEKMLAVPSTHRVRVDPLDLEATRRLVRGLLDVDEELCDFLAARAEGNPLFVTHLIQQLVIAEAVERRDGRYRLARAFDLSTVPADIRAVWSRRIDQSGASAADLATLALVRERVSRNLAEELIRLLAPISGSRLPTFEASVARALSAGLLRIEGGAYVWAHGLLRAHLISGLAPAQAARELHSLAASALASLVDREDVQEERAMHLYRAGQVREACEAMVEAGLWSFRRADIAPRRARFEAATTVDAEAAVVLVEQAIDLARSIGALRLELAAKQAWVDILWRVGDHEKARREATDLADEAGRRRLRQTVSLLELQSAAWAASERDWTDVRTHRDAAAKWGADAGALVERAVLASLDVVLAVASGEEASSISSIETFEQVRGGCADPTILEVLALAAELAPPRVAERLSRLNP